MQEKIVFDMNSAFDSESIPLMMWLLPFLEKVKTEISRKEIKHGKLYKFYFSFSEMSDEVSKI